MSSKLFAQAMTKFFSGLLIVGLLLFLPAGTLSWPQAWLLICILFIPMFVPHISSADLSSLCLNHITFYLV